MGVWGGIDRLHTGGRVGEKEEADGTTSHEADGTRGLIGTPMGMIVGSKEGGGGGGGGGC